MIGAAMRTGGRDEDWGPRRGMGDAMDGDRVNDPVRVLVVDDQTLVRKGIRSLLGLSEEVEVVGECADGDEALALLAGIEVDVVLLDLRMPGRDGIATLEAMAQRGIQVPALVLTTFDDDELVLAALRAGAKGYLLKDVTLDQLLGEAVSVSQGVPCFTGTLTVKYLRPTPLGPLSLRAETTGSEGRKFFVHAEISDAEGPTVTAEGIMISPANMPRHEELKRLLKAGFSDRLPAAIRERKDKMGFPVPLNLWLKRGGPARELIGDILGSERARTRGYLGNGLSIDAVLEVLGRERVLARLG